MIRTRHRSRARRWRPPASSPAPWGRTAGILREAAATATDSLRREPLRATLAILGIVIGIVTVVLVASVLANVRSQVALLFRELGTENVFAFHLSGDPYATASEREARRKPLEVSYAGELLRLAGSIRDVGVQIIVPTSGEAGPLVARAGDRESETVLVEGASASFFPIVGAEFAAGRPFTELEDRAGVRVAVVGASLAKALFGNRTAVGRQVTLGGESYTVVGELAPRKGGFFGENRGDSVLALPVGTARRRFGRPERVVLYAQAWPGQLDRAFLETEAILRRLRRLRPEQENDFHLSTAEQIIGVLDRVSAGIGLTTVALAAVSLLIGGIGIANVMIISVTERTREIGLRRAVGAERANVLVQFLLESAILSGLGGTAGVLSAMVLGFSITFFVRGFSAIPPLWSVAAGLLASIAVGIAAGFLPARRAAGLDPAEALRHE